MSMERLPPNDRDAERAILGGILRDPSRFDDAAVLLSADDFYTFAHGLIFEHMAALRAAGKPIDAKLLAVSIKKAGKIEDAQPAYFIELWESAPTSGDVATLATTIKAHAGARAVIQACNEILEDAFHPGTSAAELIEGAERRIFAIAQKSIRGEARPNAKVVDASLAVLDRRVSLFRRGEMIGAVPYGLIDLDRATAGMHPGELVIIGARPGIGKSLFGGHIADGASQAKLPVLFCSMEQADTELVLRMLSKHGRVNAFKVRGGTVTDQDRAAIGDAADKMRAAPIFWDDDPCQTVTRISAQARRIKAKHGLALVVVDYLQLLDSPNRRLKRYEAVGEMSRGLKLLARDLQITVVAMAQLNRDSESRGGEPKLSDLREAGSIEQDADTVILMHQPDPGSEAVVGELKLLIRKQRNGPLKSISVIHEKEYYRLGNSADAGDNEPIPEVQGRF